MLLIFQGLRRIEQDLGLILLLKLHAKGGAEFWGLPMLGLNPEV